MESGPSQARDEQGMPHQAPQPQNASESKAKLKFGIEAAKERDTQYGSLGAEAAQRSRYRGLMARIRAAPTRSARIEIARIANCQTAVRTPHCD